MAKSANAVETTKKTPAAKPASAKKTAATKTAKAAKPAAKTTVKKAVVPAKSAAPAKATEKQKKPKLVRDSFTMPENEYRVLGELKKACLKAGVEVKKSELLRIGIAMIRSMEPAAVKAAVARLAPLKAGRPKKEK